MVLNSAVDALASTQTNVGNNLLTSTKSFADYRFVKLMVAVSFAYICDVFVVIANRLASNN